MKISICRINKILTVMAFVLGFVLVQPKHVLQQDSNQITYELLLKDPFIQVEGTSKHFNIEQYEITHLKFAQSGKNKRKTYENFLRKYKKIVNCLIKNQIVPHQTAMIHSNIQMNFISKKREWQFSRIFVIYSDSKQLNRVLSYLQPFKVAKLKERLLMGYLNEKLIAIKAFTAARTKLQKFLRKKIDGKLDIIYIVDIQIEGKKVMNQQSIQTQIKNQINYSKSQHQIPVVKGDVKNRDRRQGSQKQFFDDDVTMKVLFKVGENKEDGSITEQSDQQNNSDNSQNGDQIEDDQIQISPDGQIQEEL